MSNRFSVLPEPLYLVYPSDTVLHSNPDYKSRQGDQYGLLKETICKVSGEIKVSFDLRTANSGTVFGKIYINNLPVGTERSQSENGYQTYDEDIPVHLGDLIQIFGKHSSPTGYSLVQNLILKGTLTKTFAIVY